MSLTTFSSTGREFHRDRPVPRTRSAALLILACLCITVPTLRAQDDVPRLTPEQFPLLAWNVARGNPAVFARMWDCGFNLAGFVPIQDLDAVAAAGLKCFVHDPSIPVRYEATLPESHINEHVAAYTGRAGSHPAVFGYFLADEPSAQAFPTLARWAKAFRAVAPNQLPYVNLFPNYASIEQLGTENYARYIESFIRMTELPYVSYDHYALMEDGSLRDGYFANLELVRKAALRHNIGFWNVVMSTACLNYAEPDEAGLRFQAYTTLAYGARGLSWFTYFTPAIGNFRHGPIDQFGQETPTWSMLRRVNLQIHRLGPTYLTLRSIGVFHHPNIPEGCQGISVSRHVGELTGGDLLVGEFEDPLGRPFIILVNKDLRRSTPFTIRFRSPGAVWQVSAYTGQPAPLAGEQAWLAPGQGMMLMLEPAPQSMPAAETKRGARK